MRSPGHARLLACGAAVCAGLAVAGCGAGAHRDQVRAVAERFYAAAHQGDGRTACAQLSPDTRAQLVKDASGRPCRRAVLDLSLHGRAVSSVRVYAASARVRFAGGDSVFLGDTDQGWRIDAAGCTPRGDGPADCEASS
jgi:hypothetical protein